METNVIDPVHFPNPRNCFPQDRSFLLDPFPWYARMLRESPVLGDTQSGSWIAFSYEDAQRVLTN